MKYWYFGTFVTFLTVAGISMQLMAQEYVAGVYEAHKDVKQINAHIRWINQAIKEMNNECMDCNFINCCF